MTLWPPVSGNAINGVGETEERRPSPIYWHPEGKSPFYPLQEWMMAQGLKEPAVHTKRTERAEIIAREPAPIAAQQRQAAPEQNCDTVRAQALAFGANLVGIVAPRPEWVFEGYDFAYRWIVMLGVAMDYDRLTTAPDVPAALAVIDGYTDGWRVAQRLADLIRSLGWAAEPRGGPPAGPISLVPAALACGFGELGKHGSIINREYGSNFRLAAVFTDLPLLEDGPTDIGAEDFCLNCQICVSACPADAISHEKTLVRGVEKWYVDFDRCLPFFNENYGCAVCIAVCPWSAPGRGVTLSDKMLRRRGHPRE
jgi:Pyruvate/2-oxoacid:ferredoxin oxidoreductase delta subunit